MRSFTNPDDWVRHLSTKFSAAAPYAARTIYQRLGKELYAEVLRQMRGASGQPQGSGRPSWLGRVDHPFARRHGIPTAWPDPIGVVSGELLASIRFLEERTSGKYAVSVMSVGVPYAKFVLSEDGTRTMLPRGVKQDIQKFAENKSHQAIWAFALWLRRY